MKNKVIYSAGCMAILMIGLTFFWACGDNTAQNQEMLQTIDELKKEVQTLKDIEAIKQLHIRYVNDLTYGEWDDIVECFSEDAVLAVFIGREPIKGKDAIRDTFMNTISKSDKHSGKEANLTLHPLITVDGDTAKGNWVIYFITQPDQSNDAMQLIQGIYDLEWVRENGEWKISYIEWSVRFALGPPPSEEGGPPEGSQGASGREGGQAAPK